jgi:hypothetical protein
LHDPDLPLQEFLQDPLQRGTVWQLAGGVRGEHEDPLVLACHWGDHERAVVPGLREGVCDCGLLASGEHIQMLLPVVIIGPGSCRLRTSNTTTTTRRKRMA